MSFYFNLCSSSSGNASYVGDLESGILFDAGVGVRNFKKYLGMAGISTDAVKAIFITHEHSDHIRGLEAISTKYDIPVYGSAETLRCLLDTGRISGTQKLCVLDGKTEVCGYTVTAFPTPHDSPGSVGYRVCTPDGISAGICTDLGYVTPAVMEGISGCKFLMLEANYDEQMLLNGPYPYFLKQRIAGRKGHLSNMQTAEALEKLIASGTEKVSLAHLSEHNNLPSLAYFSVEDHLNRCGIHLESDYQMNVLSKVNKGLVTELT